MATEIVDKSSRPTRSPGTCGIDAARLAAHFTGEVDFLKTIVVDAAETGMHAAKRAISRRGRDIENLRDSAAYRVRHAPLLALGGAFAVGILAALVFSQCARALRRRTPREW